jgi:glycosyltransferase involved in cell wall biosynthesis
VHFQWLAEPIGAALFVRWAQRRGSAVLYTPHNLLPHRGRWMTMPLFRRLYRVFDRIIARDAHMMWAASEMLNVDLDRMTTIAGSPNIIAHPQVPRRLPPEAPRRRPGEFRALYFGHGCARKGLASMLSALARSDCPPSLHLVLAGAGVADSIGPDVIAAARRRVRISVIGRYLDPFEVGGLFAEADLVTMPYAKLCRSPILDLAAAFRKPVLRTDRVEATRFVDGEHGLTVADGDAAAFADALIGLAYRPERTASMHETLARGPGFADEVARLADAHARLYDRTVRELSDRSPLAAGGELTAVTGE